MFLLLSVILSGGVPACNGEVYTILDTHTTPGRTPSQADTSPPDTHTTPGRTPSPMDTHTHPSGHPTSLDTPPGQTPPRAVRIRLECILVLVLLTLPSPVFRCFKNYLIAPWLATFEISFWNFSSNLHIRDHNSVIHKAAGLTVPSRSMILPGTIPETPISREWSRWLEWPLGLCE